MSKIKLTKGELKKQRDSLKQFCHYLPTLLLKKQQLQMKILEARRLLDDRQKSLDLKLNNIKKWVGLLAEPGIDLRPWVAPIKLDTETMNIAGANVPIFRDLHFNRIDYDLYEMPLWVDKGVEELRFAITLMVEMDIIKQQIEILEKELRVTTQRVNLFEKIKIPECMDNIRIIRIYLGDQQANAVGISKVAKKKIDIRSMQEVAVV